MPSFMPQYKQKPRSTPAPVSDELKARIEESKRIQQIVAPQVQPQVQDDVGWTEVRRTKRKFKRELTVEEMDARERQRETKQDDGEFNTQLFESNRHDHDRV
jgi:tRNA nucleotidyltransferase (CCA-adding enzyme)